MVRLPVIAAAERIEQRLEFADLPQGWEALASIILLMALMLSAVLLYRREQRLGVTLRARMVMAGLRLAVLAVLAVVWLEPVRATYLHRELPARTLVLIDASASMGLRAWAPDPAGEDRPASVAGVPLEEALRMSRSQLVQRILDRDGQALLKRMAERNPVAVYRFGEDLLPLGVVERPAAGSSIGRPGATPPGDGQERVAREVPAIRIGEPADPVTDIGRALRRAVDLQGDAPIAAVVVFSDGQFNRGEPAEVVGRFARSRKLPVIAVGVGEAVELPNAAVQAVDAPANVFVQDPFQVTARVRTTGMGGRSLTVELLESPAGDEPGKVAAVQTVPVPLAGDPPPVVFRHTLGAAGAARLMIRIPPVDGESLTADNQRDLTVRALDNRMRVLLVSGVPSWEYRYLTRMLERDATMDVSCWLQSADENALRDGKTVIDHFPARPAELFIYDCIILMDPNPADFDPDWARTVETMVGNNGCGLLYVAGPAYTAEFIRAADTRPLIDLLPVVFDPGEADLILNELGHFQTTAWPLSIPPTAMGHPVLHMAPTPAESVQAWTRLPGIYWHYPVRRAKPVATVLWQHSNPRMRGADGGHVLLATQFLGAGRTGFLASNSTWRWRSVSDACFNRFWVQLLRHLVEGKLVGGQRRGLIQTDRDRYEPGEAVVIEARLLDASFQPLAAGEMAASIARDGRAEATVPLAAQPGRPGWYRGRWTPAGSGLYTVSIELPAEGGQEAVLIRRDLRVEPTDIEYRQTAMNRRAMQALAAESAGGTWLDLAEADRLAELIPSRTVSLVLAGQPIRLWDRGWTLGLLVGLLGAEWMLRKRFNLL